MRGFRWQVLAFLLAVVLFTASVVVRTQNDTPIPSPSPPPAQMLTPTAAAPAPTLAPVPSRADTTTGSDIRTFREGVVGQIQRLNPLFASLNPVDRDITSLIFEGLIRSNAYGEPEPSLARSWIISSDGLEYVFMLRDDVLWQDGIPFNALDVAYTMEILRSPEFGGSNALVEFWRTVETEVLGEYLVRFRLTQPLGTFLDQLKIAILPEHALRGTTAAQLSAHPFNLTPIGTGPYQLERIESTADGRPMQINLRLAPVFRQRPEAQDRYAIEDLEVHLFDTFDAALNALATGAVDGLAARSQNERLQLADLVTPGTLIDLHTQIAPALGTLIFNWQQDETRYFREQRVRVALQAGLDRSSLIERNLTNTAVVADSPLPPSTWAYVADLPWAAYDPVTARAQLQAANLRLEAANADTATPDPSLTSQPASRFTFQILTPDDPALVRVAQEIAAQWAQLGLDVTVDAVGLVTYQDRLEAGDFDTALVEYGFSSSIDPDVYTFWNQGQEPPEGGNFGGADDRRISLLLEAARRDANGINRFELYREFQKEFASRAIAIPLYYPLFTYATAQRVSGVQLGAVGAADDRFISLPLWQIR